MALVQGLAQSRATSELGQALGLVLHPHAERRPSPPAPPGLPHPTRGLFLLNLPTWRTLLCCFLSHEWSLHQLWVRCFACSPNPCFSTQPPPSLLFAAPSFVPQACQPSGGLHHPSQLPRLASPLLIHEQCSQHSQFPSGTNHRQRIPRHPPSAIFLPSCPERVKREG